MSVISFFRLKLCLLAVIWVSQIHAQTPGSTDVRSGTVSENHCPANLNRPCIALVLGGGGARGGAHVGVLEAIEEQGIPVDIIVGTSIGAFVGGLYATGKSPAEIRELFIETDWNTGYRDDLGRSGVPNRRKRQIDQFPIQLDLGFDGTSVSLPRGLIQGQGMKAMVDGMLGFFPQFTSFDELSIPFRAVAADIETGEAYILGEGDLATALQISMSLPGILRPIELDGHLLVDGGIANNLPVDVARSMGAELVIAVDIGSGTMAQEDLQSGVTILRQLTGFLTRDNVEYQKSLLTEQDVLVEPVISTVTMTAFERIEEAMDPGYQATMAALQNSVALQSLPIQQPLTNPGPTPLPAEDTYVNLIALENNSRLADDYILRRLNITEGDLYSPLDLQRGIYRLYGQGTIARITTSLETTSTGNQLDIEVDEKEWGPGYLDFKFSFEDDFSTFSRYQLGTSFRLTNLSPYGAEWYSTAEIGTEKFVSTELYWPIGNTGFFWDAAAGYSDLNFVFTDETGESLGEVQSTRHDLITGLGWNLSDSLDVLLAGSYIDGNSKLPAILAEATGVSDIDFKQPGLLLRINYDSLDNATFPTRGWKLSTDFLRSRDEYLDTRAYTNRVDTEFNGVVSLGKHNFRGLLRYQSFLTDNSLSVLGTYELGGFLNLSGIPKDTISGQHVRYISGVYTYELAANDFGAIQLPLFIGASLEAGNAWNDRDDVDFGDLISAGSLFIGWNSPLGPAYFAWGRAENNQSSFYLFLGVTF